MAMWILNTTAAAARIVSVAIETPYGPVVESLMEQGFAVHSINPKRLDRFRDRFSPAGAKDGHSDARVLAEILRASPDGLRKIEPIDPLVVALRQGADLSADLTLDQIRYVNRLRGLLRRYYPQFLEIARDDLAESWILELWTLAPTPQKAQRLSQARVERLLKQHCIQRVSADEVIRILRKPALQVPQGTTEAAVASIGNYIECLTVIQHELAEVDLRVDRLAAELAESGKTAPGQNGERRDV